MAMRGYLILGLINLLLATMVVAYAMTVEKMQADAKEMLSADAALQITADRFKYRAEQLQFALAECQER